jgi:hypothetical protein
MLLLRSYTQKGGRFGHSVAATNFAIQKGLAVDLITGRTHKALANPYPLTPAMAAGLADHVLTCEEIGAVLD